MNFCSFSGLIRQSLSKGFLLRKKPNRVRKRIDQIIVKCQSAAVGTTHYTGQVIGIRNLPLPEHHRHHLPEPPIDGENDRR